MKSRAFPGACLVVLSTALVVAACSAGSSGGTGGGRSGAAPLPVAVATAEARSMPVSVRAIGTVQSLSSVALMPRVTGQIAAIRFREGQDVAAGAVLFSLDRGPFEVALAQAQALLAQAQARARNSAAEAARYTELRAGGVVSQEQFDTAISAADVASAALAAAEAAELRARLDLEYCEIRAPFAGRTGALLVHVGAAVKASETALVTLKQLEPIGVAFAAPERELSQIRELAAAGPLSVRATPRDGSPVEGRLAFIDNTVNAAAGTIGLKARFDNAERKLWPGEFVDVVLVLRDQLDAVVVPAAAVQAGQRGSVVFVVGADRRVELRPVTVDRTAGDEAVIGEGLQPGETVVTDGQLRLVPGVEVSIKTGAEPS